jgi:hypothetical protein
MRPLIFSLAVISLSLCAVGQARSSSNNDGVVIQQVKNLFASSFDSRLPRVSLEYFLAYETDGAASRWVISECEKQSANRSADPRRNSSLCVRANFDLNSGGALTILIRVEKSQNEQFCRESVVSLAVTELTGTVRQIRSLSDLPMELHSVFPSKPPNDLPLPNRDS